MFDSERRELVYEPRAVDERRRNVFPIYGTQTPTLPRSLFADNCRFLSMLAILGLHSAGAIQSVVADPSSLYALKVLEAIEKFGTIGFFFVSGFLLGERFETGSPLQFLGRRLRKICLPWVVWFGVILAGYIVEHRIRLSLDLVGRHLILRVAAHCIFATPLWFVPNLFVSIFLLMMCRRYLWSPWLGTFLFSITTFYAINTHVGWISTSHTIALGGYVSFLWLGAFFSHHYDRFMSNFASIPFKVVIGMVIILWALSLGESRWLLRIGSLDDMNTLRMSNLLLSVSVLCLIMKLNRAAWPNFIDVRKQMFGVYLSHAPVLAIIVGVASRASAVRRFFGHSSQTLEILGSTILLHISLFITCLIITKQLAGVRWLAWLVGDTSQSVPRFQTSQDDKLTRAVRFTDAAMEQHS